MKPPARAVIGDLVWSTDGGVWAVWQVRPFPHAHTAASDQLCVHARIEGALIALPEESMLLSVCEVRDPWDVVAEMIDGVDVDARPAWAEVCSASADWLAANTVFRRRYYLAALLPAAHRRAWNEPVSAAGAAVAASFGLPPASIPLGRSTPAGARPTRWDRVSVPIWSSPPCRPASCGGSTPGRSAGRSASRRSTSRGSRSTRVPPASSAAWMQSSWRPVSGSIRRSCERS